MADDSERLKRVTDRVRKHLTGLMLKPSDMNEHDREDVATAQGKRDALQPSNAPDTRGAGHAALQQPNDSKAPPGSSPNTAEPKVAGEAPGNAHKSKVPQGTQEPVHHAGLRVAGDHSGPVDAASTVDESDASDNRDSHLDAQAEPDRSGHVDSKSTVDEADPNDAQDVHMDKQIHISPISRSKHFRAIVDAYRRNK